MVINAIRQPVSFTVAELWLLSDVIKHTMAEEERWKWPITSKEVCDEIAFAIVACVDGKLEEYTLDLCETELLAIDYCLNHDMKTPEGAKASEILLKTFRARLEMAFGGLLSAECDETYAKAQKRSGD